MPSYLVKHPILIIVFNRPEETKTVFNAVKKVRPKRLYIAADGPRINVKNEAVKCTKTLSVFKNIDWPCDIFFKVNDFNLGSYTNIPEAIDWFFEKEEAGIVLEDDCVGNMSFFRYCDELLERHKSDQRILWINGTNLGYQGEGIESSYCYSIYPISWGWASWRRAWKIFDGDNRKILLNGVSTDVLARYTGGSLKEKLYWRYIFEYSYAINNWDYRWMYTFWKYGGLACSPKVNMISNIGFGPGGMHCERRDDPRGFIQTNEIKGDIIPPKELAPFTVFDRFLNQSLYKIGIISIIKIFIASRFPNLRNLIRYLRGRPI